MLDCGQKKREKEVSLTVYFCIPKTGQSDEITYKEKCPLLRLASGGRKDKARKMLEDKEDSRKKERKRGAAWRKEISPLNDNDELAASGSRCELLKKAFRDALVGTL